ncbi:MAG: NAD(P)H-quinone oxidoreductase [Cohaesibacter sp.]|jgi:putative PIG3 family NAD(P)H quinone oxidoreductase|nr:NAD(P)H-quinone oxidoreductase [Cohaesibacter sp.]
MRAVIANEPGGPEQLIIEQRPIPSPKDEEVLIKIAYAGVNRPDCIQRSGGYPPPPGAPDIFGLEVSGEIVALGKAVSKWAIGDKVTALVAGGGYADYCCADQGSLLPIPKGLDMHEAAALPETFFTVWSNVFQRAGLQSGETFLVHGGSSGIGTTAIQLAKAFGAKVLTTAGSDEKCRICEQLGADLAINYRNQDWVSEVRSWTGKKGANVILDMVGGDYISKNYVAAATEGRIVSIAFLQGGVTEADFRRLMMKRLVHTGSTLRARSTGFKAQIASELFEKVWPLLEGGSIKPLIHETFSLEDAAKAHALMESSQHIGKIMLKIS